MTDIVELNTEFQNFLPANATQLEIDLLRLIFKKFAPLMTSSTLLGRSFKNFNDIPDSYIPYLIQDFGLGEIAGILKDPRRALAEGVKFQRIRGTPAALVQVLEWLGIVYSNIETNGPGPNFAKFQIELAEVPDAETIYNLLRGVRLATPVRCHLTRIHSGYNVSILVWDKYKWDDVLYDSFSGVFNDDFGVYLSFKKKIPTTIILDNKERYNKNVLMRISGYGLLGLIATKRTLNSVGMAVYSYTFNTVLVPPYNNSNWTGSWDTRSWSYNRKSILVNLF